MSTIQTQTESAPVGASTASHEVEAITSKNPMRSTWYTKPAGELDWAQKFIRRLGVLPDEEKLKAAPVAKKGGESRRVSRSLEPIELILVILFHTSDSLRQSASGE